MMRNFYFFCLGLMISICLFFVPYARAQTVSSYSGLDHINRLIGNMGAPGNIGGRLGAQFAANAIGPGGLATAAGDVLIKPSGLSIPVSMRAALPVGRMASIAGACMSGGVIGPLGCVAGVAMIGIELKNHGVFGTCSDGSTDLFCKPSPMNCTVAPCFEFRGRDSVWTRDLSAACNSYIGFAYSTGYGPATFNRITSSYGGASAACQLHWKVNSGPQEGDFWQALGVRGVAVNPVDPVPATRQEIIDELNGIAAVDYAANQRILQEMQKDVEKNGGLWPYDQRPVRDADTVTVDAPPVESPARTTKVETIPKEDGSTDTRTTSEVTKVSPKVSGTKVGDTKVDFPSTTTSTVTTTNSVTNTTTTTTTVVNNEAPQQDQESISFADKDMPDLPKLYERKYPDGFAGVWRDHKPDIASTQFWQGVKSMFPNFSSGSCPSWSMQFDIMRGAQFGSVPFAVPCWIWQAIGLIVLTTAAFTARKIIF